MTLYSSRYPGGVLLYIGFSNRHRCTRHAPSAVRRQRLVLLHMGESNPSVSRRTTDPVVRLSPCLSPSLSHSHTHTRSHLLSPLLSHTLFLSLIRGHATRIARHKPTDMLRRRPAQTVPPRARNQPTLRESSQVGGVGGREERKGRCRDRRSPATSSTANTASTTIARHLVE